MIPAKPDYLSTLGIEQLHKNIEELVDEYNDTLENVKPGNSINPQELGIAFTMVQKRNGDLIQAQKYYRNQVERLEYSCFNCSVRENKTIYASAPEDLIPVVLMDVSGDTYVNVREELEQITTEFLGRLGV